MKSSDQFSDIKLKCLLFSQPDLVKEFETNAELCKKDQSIPSHVSTDTRNTKTTSTTEPTSIPSDTPTVLNSTKNSQQNFETKTLDNSSGIRKHVSNSFDKDMLRSVKQASCESEPSKLQNAEELQSSLKNVLRTANATTTNIMNGKMLEKPAENEEDDELEFLLSLGTSGMNKNSASSAALQNKEVS